jgi:drug/metabolite transporter (DMT)-like permease
MESRSHKANRSTALSAVISLPIIWGTTFAVVQSALTDVTPTAFVLIRFSLCSLFFFAISRAARQTLMVLVRPRSREQRVFRRDMLVMGLAICGGYILQTVGLLTTSSSKSAFLTSTTIIWTPLMAWALGREKITLQLALAVVITLVGIVLLTQPFRSAGFVIGDLLTIGCAMSFGVYIIVIDKAMHRAQLFAKDEHDATMMVTTGQVFVGSLFFLLVMPLIETPHVHLTTGSVSALLYTGIFATCLTAYLQSRYQHHVSPSTAAVIYMLEPVVAWIIAAIFLDEQLGTLETIGGVLIIAGVVVAQITFRRDEHSGQWGDKEKTEVLVP